MKRKSKSKAIEKLQRLKEFLDHRTKETKVDVIPIDSTMKDLISLVSEILQKLKGTLDPEEFENKLKKFSDLKTLPFQVQRNFEFENTKGCIFKIRKEAEKISDERELEDFYDHILDFLRENMSKQVKHDKEHDVLYFLSFILKDFGIDDLH